MLGPFEDADAERQGKDKGDAISSYLHAMKQDGVSRSEAVKLVSQMTDTPKAKIYRIALDMEW